MVGAGGGRLLGEVDRSLGVGGELSFAVPWMAGSVNEIGLEGDGRVGEHAGDADGRGLIDEDGGGDDVDFLRAGSGGEKESERDGADHESPPEERA